MLTSEDDSAPEALQRGAILALSQQLDAAKDLVPYLTDKRYPIRAAAHTTLVAMGPAGLPAVLDGLESESVEARAACYGVAQSVTKNRRVVEDLTFWKPGKPDDRAKALTEWKQWAEVELKPKEETPAKGM